MLTTADDDLKSPACPDTAQPRREGRLLVIEDEVLIRDILVRKLTSLGHRAESGENGRRALELLRMGSYDLVISDLGMPDLAGADLLKEILSIDPDMAVILVTSIADISTAVGALKEGAYDYILKPFSLQEVSIVVARALEKRRLLLQNRRHQQVLEEQVHTRTRELREALDVLKQSYRSTLLALGAALDSRDADTESHSLRVTLYAMRLGLQAGLRGKELQVLEQGALLHDIGKLGIPDALLKKPGPLTEEEWVIMRKHPWVGYRILSGIKFLSEASTIVLQHQERYDGTGYPAGLKGREIVEGARIFAVADTLDCITSERQFQKAGTFEEAREEIVRVSGKALDPHLVDKFLEIPLQEWRRIREQVGISTSRCRYSGVLAH